MVVSSYIPSTGFSRETLDTPIQFVKGVGPQRAEVLNKIGVEFLEDLLFYFPRTHQDRKPQLIQATKPGTKSAIKGKITHIEFKQIGRSLGQAKAFVQDSSGIMPIVWFKHVTFKYDVFGSIKKNVIPDSTILCYGTVEWGPEGKTLRVEDFESQTNQDNGSFNFSETLVPVYPLTEGLQDRWLRSLIQRVVFSYSSQILDPLPEKLRLENKLLPLPSAIQKYHFPQNRNERDQARERLAFDEFFFIELALGINRKNRVRNFSGFSSLPKRHLLTPFKNNLGYEFTKGQARAINEIFRDMQAPQPMNRLLQGDVGSGKTVVALSAGLLSIENNRQAAFLAPTEILAIQHHLTFSRFFKNLPVKVALLTSSTPKPERNKIINDLKTGKINFLIGTHALLSEDVGFQLLGVVIIDEQHRFGVQQRAKLVRKSTSSPTSRSEHHLIEKTQPDVLILTATPIPRTLAMTLYGDLDVSIMEEMPPGRSPIHTEIISETHAINKIKETLTQHQQSYIVFPLIEESEVLSKRAGKAVRAAKSEFERLKSKFSGFKLALLHGQMDFKEKKKILDSFREGELDILVATPVIEVGIDVPNATTMSIFNPERFGLAQLHQLRGRVGRGPHPSKCFLISDEPLEKAGQRLHIFCHTQNGFRLAEEDLKLRGPGEFLGEAQHGLPIFKVGDLINDAFLILQTRNAAQALVDGHTALTMTEFGRVNNVLTKRFGKKLNLSQIG